MARKRVTLSAEAVKKAGLRSTRASAKLENREVPVGHVRSEAVQRYIDNARSRICPIVCNRKMRTVMCPQLRLNARFDRRSKVFRAV